jgi:uroporphyrinogen III methyltransferase/synthase
MPKKHVAEALAQAFVDEVGSIENTMMLWVRAKGARDVISQALGKAGVILDEAIAYQTVPETEDPTGAVKRFKEEGADIITFTSASTVECFLDLGLSIPERCMIASIGPVTSEAVEENGYTVDLEAKEHDIPGLVAAVLKLGKG